MHPTIEQIADHEAGLSSVDDARWIAEHLDSCGQCREAIARLTEVRDLLADAGGDIPKIPDDVAERLDRTLATAAVERATGVPSLDERRTGSRDSDGSGSSGSSSVGTGTPGRRGRWVLGAAAAVAVVAIGAAVASNGLPGPTTQADSAASGSSTDNTLEGAGSSGSGQAAGGAKDQPGDQDFSSGSHPGRRPTPTLDSGNVSAFARDLSGGKVNSFLSLSSSSCDHATEQRVAPASSASSPLDALVKFEGRKALLRIQREQRLLTVYACPGPARVLYRSTY
jgi:hypothetical protein